MGRLAHVTEGTKPGAGRISCQYRNRCGRGCPGAYFSSQSSTLPMAEATGNMTLRPNSIVYEVVFDPKPKKHQGSNRSGTNMTYTYNAKIIAFCASAVATSIPCNRNQDTFQRVWAIARVSSVVLMDHFEVGAYATFDGFQDQYYTEIEGFLYSTI